MSVIVDDRDDQVKYNGDWGREGSSNEYLSTTSGASTQGHTVSFTFVGTSVGVFGTVGPGSGATMDFNIDQASFGSYTAPSVLPALGLSHQPFWASGPLADGSHTLSIALNSTESETATLFLDYFLYESTSESTLGKTLFIDDNDAPTVGYSSGWSLVNANGYFKQTAHTSRSAGASLSLTFAGSVISVHGPIFFGANGESFNASVAIDGGSPVPIQTQPQQSQAGTTTLNMELFISPALAPGNHTIVITALDDSPFGVDYFLFGDFLGGASSSAPPDPSPSQSVPPKVSYPSSLVLSAIISGALGGLAVSTLVVVGLLLWKRRARSLIRSGGTTPRWTPRPTSSVTASLDIEIPDSESTARQPIHPFLLRLAKQREPVALQPESPPPQYLSHSPSLGDDVPDV
ncbi:hypothetical protein FB451DRAFT_1432832 [Mycena latifolia]|nr:hypothetical protein FB451DRAFT_1432832 [Mycena latifolia]